MATRRTARQRRLRCPELRLPHGEHWGRLLPAGADAEPGGKADDDGRSGPAELGFRRDRSHPDPGSEPQGSHGQITRRQARTARRLLRAVCPGRPKGRQSAVVVDRGHPGLPSWTWVAAGRYSTVRFVIAICRRMSEADHGFPSRMRSSIFSRARVYMSGSGCVIESDRCDDSILGRHRGILCSPANTPDDRCRDEGAAVAVEGESVSLSATTSRTCRAVEHSGCEMLLAGPVPLIARLAVLAAPIRSVSESKKPLAKIVASALAVVDGILLPLWGVVLLGLREALPMSVRRPSRRAGRTWGIGLPLRGSSGVTAALFLAELRLLAELIARCRDHVGRPEPAMTLVMYRVDVDWDAGRSRHGDPVCLIRRDQCRERRGVSRVALDRTDVGAAFRNCRVRTRQGV